MASYEFIIGIDNGISGAACGFSTKYDIKFTAFSARKRLDGGQILDLDKTYERFVDLIPEEYRNGTKKANAMKVLMLLERPIGQKSTGKTTIAALQSSAGSYHVLLNICYRLQKEYGFALDVITPQKWRNFFWPPKVKKPAGKDNKELSIMKANTLYPYLNFRKTPKSTCDFDGFCEALLICHYAYKNL